MLALCLSFSCVIITKLDIIGTKKAYLELIQVDLEIIFGTEGRTRTDTPLREPDFESSASANFATSAHLGIVNIAFK